MKRSAAGVIVLGLGAGLALLAALLLVVTGVRMDERGEDPYVPELYLL